MHIGTDKDLHRAMKKHLRTGVMPGQFGMDALRIEELRHRTTCRANGRLTGSAAAPSAVFARILAQVVSTLERLRDALLRQAAVGRTKM